MYLLSIYLQKWMFSVMYIFICMHIQYMCIYLCKSISMISIYKTFSIFNFIVIFYFILVHSHSLLVLIHFHLFNHSFIIYTASVLGILGKLDESWSWVRGGNTLGGSVFCNIERRKTNHTYIHTQAIWCSLISMSLTTRGNRYAWRKHHQGQKKKHSNFTQKVQTQNL